ncbi:hypothetical protein IWZ01DRAFT_487062 [Phyllosticta capitalensis]
MARKGYGFILEAMSGFHGKLKADSYVDADSDAMKRTESGKQGHRSATTNKFKVTGASNTAECTGNKMKHFSEEDLDEESGDGAEDSENRSASACPNLTCQRPNACCRRLSRPSPAMASAPRATNAILESQNRQWKEAYQVMRDDKDRLGYRKDELTQRSADERLKKHHQTKALRNNITKLESSLEQKQRNNRELKHELVKAGDDRKKFERSFEAKLAQAHKAIKTVKSDLEKARGMYTELVSDVTELVKSIHAFDNVPSVVASATQKMSDKIVRPWKFRKD